MIQKVPQRLVWAVPNLEHAISKAKHCEHAIVIEGVPVMRMLIIGLLTAFSRFTECMMHARPT